MRADGLADAVAVLRAPLQGAQDEHVQGALEQFQAPFVGVLGHGRRESTPLDVDRLRHVPSRSSVRPGLAGARAADSCRGV